MREWMSLALRSVSNRHRPGTRPNVFVFTTPRSGSTWLMELIQTQPRFKQCSEPLNLRVPGIARRLGISDWEALYQDANWPRVRAYFEGLCEGRIRLIATFSFPSPGIKSFSGTNISPCVTHKSPSFIANDIFCGTVNG